MKEKWIVSQPKFESDYVNSKLKFAYWVGHRYFVYDLLNVVKPKSIVELGSQYGCSLFAMAQSIKDNKLECKINAIDLWKGDIGAQHDGEEVFKMVQNILNIYFKDLSINLHQSTFDESLDLFEKESIDLIHIDGNHEYNAVKHDFETWLPKLKKDGIMLFHDVFSPIEEGACIFWEELKNEYENYFEFKHSCGLGVLFPKGEANFKKLKNMGLFDGYIDLYTYKSEYEYLSFRFKEIEELYVERYTIIQNQSEMIKERDNTIKSNEQMIKERDNTIKSNEQMIKERDNTIKSNEQMIKERDNTIKSNEQMIKERDNTIKLNEEIIKERDNTIKSNEQMIKERDNTIKLNEEIIKGKDKIIEYYEDKKVLRKMMRRAINNEKI